LEATGVADRPTGSVKFFFGNQASPQILTKLESYVAAPKNAKQLGANAVVNIASYYKKDTLSSATEFECHAGASAHVMLRGEFVKIPDH
jgi:hypothetical protein